MGSKRGAADPALLPLLVVVGPTGSGKTTLAIRLAQALDGEVINADSVQIYRHFDIGSAKPTAAEQGLAPHHLVSALDPLDDIEASRFVALADLAIANVRERSRVPIVCGGTFLWVRALLYGLAAAPAGDADLRARHQSLVQRLGAPALHDELAQVDPSSAARLHVNDVLRVSRALEVFQLSGQKMSDLHAAHGFARARYEALLLGVQWDRPKYDQHLFQRAALMLEQGWVDEVRELLAAGYGSARAMSAVGYKQVRQAVQAGTWDTTELATSITRATRVFARRQRTWLRDQPVKWLTAEQMGSAEEWTRVLDECRRGLD